MTSTNNGLFASSLVEGFFGFKRDKEEQDNKNKIIKLQTKLIEQQLNAGKVKLDAQTKLSDILTGSVGEFEQIGEAAPTPSGSPLGEDGRQPVPQFESTGNEPPGLAELLSNPESLAALLQSGQLDLGDLIGKPGQDPANVRALDIAGVKRGTEEFKEAILNNLDAGADDQALSQLILGQQTENLAEQKRERELTEKTEGEEKIGRRQAVRNDFGNAKRIIQLQQELEGTALAVGIPYGDFLRDIGAGAAALVAQLGFDPSAAQAAIAKRDELVRLFADGTLEAIDRFKGTGTITNQKFDALIAASPEVGKTAVANAKVLAGRMQAVLDAAERKSEIIPNRKEIEDWIEEMKGLTIESPVSNPAVNVPEGLEAIDKRLAEIKAELSGI